VIDIKDNETETPSQIARRIEQTVKVLAATPPPRLLETMPGLPIQVASRPNVKPSIEAEPALAGR
jgi:hypothetical protein